MILPRVAIIAALLSASAVSAHEAAGRHGGRVADAGPFHVELVTQGVRVEIYLADGAQKPVASAGFKGTAILVVGGKPARILLEPADGNRLTGTAATDVGAHPKGAVQLTAPDGAAASGSFK